jgi:hypothetical protein
MVVSTEGNAREVRTSSPPRLAMMSVNWEWGYTVLDSAWPSM